jgi:hypothetical protein
MQPGEENKPVNDDRQRREGKLGGVRLVGVFVPWQGMALILAVVIGLTAIVTLRASDDGVVRVEQTASEAAVAETTVTTRVPSTTTSTVAPTSTSTTMSTSTTTTAPPTTTTTTLAPGSADVAIFNGGGASTMIDGYCNEPADWSFIAACAGQPIGPEGRPELIITVDTNRYPRSARVFLDLLAGANHDATYCLRLYDLDRASGVPGSERCLTSPAVATPAPYTSWPPRPVSSEHIGPISLRSGKGRYTLQAKVTRASTAEPCHYPLINCDGALSRAGLSIEWG